MNLLPRVTYVDGKCQRVADLLENLGESDETSLFTTNIVKDFYAFQWDSYAKYVHYLGAVIHFCYFITFVVYTNEVYLHRHYEARAPLCWLMLVCIIYPLFYDSMQLLKQKADYLKDPWNLVDQCHIWIGLANIMLQRFQPDILTSESQIIMFIVALIMLIKTFFFLRIVNSLSKLVSMLQTVVSSLGPFFLFYFILLLMCGCLLSIIDWANFEFYDDAGVR